MAAQVDQQLRQARASAYKDLWKLTSVLPRWPKRDDVTLEELDSFRRKLKDWYFEVGGLYLSRRGFERYAELQDALAALDFKDPKKRIAQEAYEAIRARCSALRSSLTDDLLSRRPQSMWPF